MAATDKLHLNWAHLVTEGGSHSIYNAAKAPQLLEQAHMDMTAGSTADDLFRLFRINEVNIDEDDRKIFPDQPDPNDDSQYYGARMNFIRTQHAAGSIPNATTQRLAANREKYLPRIAAAIAENRADQNVQLVLGRNITVQEAQTVMTGMRAKEPAFLDVLKDRDATATLRGRLQDVQDHLISSGRFSFIELPFDKSFDNKQGIIVGFRTLTNDRKPALLLMSYAASAAGVAAVETIDAKNASVKLSEMQKTRMILETLRADIRRHLQNWRADMAIEIRALATQKAPSLTEPLRIALSGIAENKKPQPAIAAVVVATPAPITTVTTPSNKKGLVSEILASLAGVNSGVNLKPVVITEKDSMPETALPESNPVLTEASPESALSEPAAMPAVLPANETAEIAKPKKPLFKRIAAKQDVAPAIPHLDLSESLAAQLESDPKTQAVGGALRARNATVQSPETPAQAPREIPTPTVQGEYRSGVPAIARTPVKKGFLKNLLSPSRPRLTQG